MGVQPALRRQPDFSPTVIGNGMSAFYGGSTGAHIRRVTIPLVYCDFLSMYPSVNTLMGLWRFITAKQIEVKDAMDEIIHLLGRINKDQLFKPNTWRRMPAFVQIEPQGDVLPARAVYDDVAKSWQVGVIHVHAEASGGKLWYALPDVVAAVLLTGNVPRVLRAVRLVPKGKMRGLRPVMLGGKVLVDPRKTDFFKTVIEERKSLSKLTDITDEERSRLDRFF